MNFNKKLALIGATIIDGLGNKPFKSNILIDNDVITDIITSEAIPNDYTVVDLSNKYIMPGMIEMHGHFFANRLGKVYTVLEQYTKLFLAGGVTTVRSAGERDPEKVFEYRDAINNGEKIGPRIITAGYYLNRLLPELKEMSVGWIPFKESFDELKELYDKQLGKVDQIKIYNCMTADWIKKICDIAHSDGLKVYGHIDKCTAKDAIEAGIDGLEHGVFNMPDFYKDGEKGFNKYDDFDPNGSKAKELVELIIKNNIAITPTTVIVATAGKDVTKRIEDNNIFRFYDKDELAWHKERRVNGDADVNEVETQNNFMRRNAEFIYNIYKAGGKVFCGTDPVYSPLIPGYGIVWEAENLNKIGIPIDYLIKALTSEAAKELGIFDVTGSITKGKQADLIVLNKNPMDSISNLLYQERVYKAGVEFIPEKLRNELIGCFNMDKEK